MPTFPVYMKQRKLDDDLSDKSVKNTKWLSISDIPRTAEAALMAKPISMAPPPEGGTAAEMASQLDRSSHPMEQTGPDIAPTKDVVMKNASASSSIVDEAIVSPAREAPEIGPTTENITVVVRAPKVMMELVMV
jgi:hypothetical protein